VIVKNPKSKPLLGTWEDLMLGMLLLLICKLILILMKLACLLTRLSNKGKQGNPLNLRIRSPLPKTTPLTRGALTPFLNPQIYPLPFHKEPQLYKRSKPIKIDPILSLCAIEGALNAKDFRILLRTAQTERSLLWLNGQPLKRCLNKRKRRTIFE